MSKFAENWQMSLNEDPDRERVNAQVVRLARHRCCTLGAIKASRPLAAVLTTDRHNHNRCSALVWSVSNPLARSVVGSVCHTHTVSQLVSSARYTRLAMQVSIYVRFVHITVRSEQIGRDWEMS